MPQTKQEKAIHAKKFTPKKILSPDQGDELIHQHSKKFGTDFQDDYNSMSTNVPNVERIFSKDQPRFDSTGKKIKRFPKLDLFIKIKGK